LSFCDASGSRSDCRMRRLFFLPMVSPFRLTYDPFALAPRHLNASAQSVFLAHYLAPSCTIYTQEVEQKLPIMPSGRVISSFACITAPVSISFLHIANIQWGFAILSAPAFHFRRLVCIVGIGNLSFLPLFIHQNGPHKCVFLGGWFCVLKVFV
jgi:hypothetical protein